MPDDHEPIEGLSGDQLAERAKALLLEAEYWQLVLDDCGTINDAVLASTTAVIDSTSAAIGVVALVGPHNLPAIESVLGGNRAALDSLRTIGESLERVLELAEGRAKALAPVVAAVRAAAGLDDGDDDDQAGDDAA